MNMILVILTILEDILRSIRESIIRKKHQNFLKKFKIEEIDTEKINAQYNPYEGTATILLDTLIKSKAIRKEDKILDIGCGAGVVMIYLANKGFNHIMGYELDKKLYSLCLKNINKYKNSHADINTNLFVYNCDAVNSKIDDNISAIYLFNPFYDTATYAEWLKRVHESFIREKRSIKIIALYPTITFRIALDQCDWLIKKWRIICKEHPCSKCMHFLVYKTKLT